MSQTMELPWIGEFNSDWEIVPNKAVIKPKKVSVGTQANEYVLLSLTKQGVIVRDLDEGGKFPENFDSYQQVEPGDLVLCLFDVEETPRTIGIANESGMITGAYDVFEFTDKVNPRYFEYYYLALDQRKGLKYFYSGLRNVIRTPVFLSIPMLLPPRPVQDEIVKFLDKELATIDHLLTKLRDLQICLALRFESYLNDQFSDLIGEGTPIRYLAKHLDARNSDSDYPLMSVSKFHGVIMRSEITDKLSRADSLENYKVCKPGDLVINRMSANTGALGVAKQLGLISPDYMVLEFLDAHNSTFVENLFKSPRMRSEMSSRVRGIGTIDSVGVRTPRLTWANLAEVRVNFPTRQNQNQIVSKLDAMKRLSDALLTSTSQVIQALEDRKISLISSTVTGKIDVQDIN